MNGNSGHKNIYIKGKVVGIGMFEKSSSHVQDEEVCGGNWLLTAEGDVDM